MWMKKQFLGFILVFIFISASFTSFVGSQSLLEADASTSSPDFVDNPVEYRALLVGVETYPIYKLPFSVDQLEGFETTLLNGGNWKEENIVTVKNDRATKNVIQFRLNEFKEVADDNDITLFYFIGHGGKNRTNEYIRPIDDVIYDVELNQYLTNLSGKIIIVLDTCYSGGFIEELQGDNRVIVTASAKDEVTYQVADLRSGMFGYFFNMSFSWLSKNVEHSYFYTKFFMWLYGMKLSQDHDETIAVHPQIADGIQGPTRLIRRHRYINKIGELLSKMIEVHHTNQLWKMSS